MCQMQNLFLDTDNLFLFFSYPIVNKWLYECMNLIYY